MRRPLALLLLSLVLCAGCRIHDLHDGTYTFTVTQVIRDECGLAAQQPLGPASLVTSGNEVDLSFTTPDVRLSGIYKDGVQQMVLDGALTNYETLVRGQTCLLDSFTLHTDTVTVDPTDFTGTMSIVYDARTPDSCVCKFWFDYSAAHTN